MIKFIPLLLAFSCLFILPACGQNKDLAYHTMLKGLYTNNVPVITPAALSEKMQKPSAKVLILDTRTLEEFEVSHLQQAQFVNYNSFKVNQLQDVPKNTPIVVYCSVGYRSEKIGEKLISAGYTNVQNLYGGIFEWVNKGFKVYDAKGPTVKVHAYSKSWGVWLNKGEKVYE